MIKINYPETELKTKRENHRSLVFDVFRRKWVTLTPEEWVRQHFLHFITDILLYPASLIAIEKEIALGELKKRCDVVVYDKQSVPWMIIECKEMSEPLNDAVLSQILRYHITLSAPYLVITNGVYCYAFKKTGDSFHEMDQLPSY